MEDKISQLNDTDKKVLDLLHRGVVKTPDIAKSLGIDQRAVRQALGHLRGILGVESREALLQRAKQLGYQFEEPTS